MSAAVCGRLNVLFDSLGQPFARRQVRCTDPEGYSKHEACAAGRQGGRRTGTHRNLSPGLSSSSSSCRFSPRSSRSHKPEALAKEASKGTSLRLRFRLVKSVVSLIKSTGP